MRAGLFMYSLAVPSVLRRLWPSDRRLRIWLAAGGIVLLLAAFTRTLPGSRAASLPTGEAQWIWKPLDRKDHQPSAFYAVRDFALASPPVRARLLVAGDEEYVVTLNARPVGAGAYEPGAPLDVYEVGPLLVPGGNRLVVELRSGRGVGGLLLSLNDEASGRPLVVSDQSWRVFSRHQLGLLRGWLPAAAGQPAFCWGYPPIGRWGRPRLARPVPLLAAAGGPFVPAAAAQPITVDLGTPQPRRPPGSPVLYDWGREVEGYLTLDLPPGKELGMGLLFTGDTPPDPLRARSASSVLILPGRHDWMDARPRRFRYALLVGLARPVAASVRPAGGRTVREAPPPPSDGEAFGIAGPPLRTPVEDEVWGKLQRLAGIARREEL